MLDCLSEIFFHDVFIYCYKIPSLNFFCVYAINLGMLYAFHLTKLIFVMKVSTPGLINQHLWLKENGGYCWVQELNVAFPTSGLGKRH